MVPSCVTGALYSPLKAQAIVTACFTLGACSAFLLSALIGQPLVRHFFPAKMKRLEKTVDANRDHLLWYTLFLRVSPVFPNWFVNIGCPLVGIRLDHFAVCTFFGLQIPTAMTIQIGQTLQAMGASGADGAELDFITAGARTLAVMFALQFLVLAPVWQAKRKMLSAAGDE
jgi:uncharacterized membrane protein YdjX (TVP38/TMEM64 family)